MDSIFKSCCLLLCLVLALSCNDRTDSEKCSLEATLEVTLYRDEVVQLFYKLKTDDGYSEPLSIKKSVMASEDFQKIQFILPEGVQPKNIRIDFGEKPGVDSLKIREISFSYKDLRLIGDNNRYREWFSLNPNISYDSIKDMYYTFPTEDGVYDPLIYGNDVLNKRLVKLFPPDVNAVFFN